MRISGTTIIRNRLLPFIECKEGAQSIYAVRRHSHEELSFGFIEKGCSRISCKTLKLHLEVNQAVLIPPESIHLCQPDDAEKFIFRMLYVDPSWLFSVFHVDARALRPQAAQLDRRRIQEKERFWSSFADFDDPFRAESEAVFFIGSLFHDVFNIGPKRPASEEKAPDAAVLKAYMDENFSEQIQLDDLSALSGKSKFSMLREFKARHKLTPHAYLLNKRINESKRLLRKGETVARTAARCGFFDQSHFVKTFRRYVGMNPVDYT